MLTLNIFDHNPDENPQWRPLVGTRVYVCSQCGTETTIQTNHCGTVWNQRCGGRCKQILNPHTACEIVLPFYGPHRYVREA